MNEFVRMKVEFDRVDTILDLRLPLNPPVGRYAFASGLADPYSGNFYTISSVKIQIY